MNAQEFLDQFNQKLREKYKKGEYAPNPYRASSAGECTRKLAYIKLYPDLASSEEDEIDETLGSRFELGNILHDTERARIQEFGYELTDVEATFTQTFMMNDFSELVVKGKVDGILTFDDGTKVVLDIKTAGDGPFKKVKSMGLPYAYKAQAQFYLDATNLKEMWFWYYNKNTSERMTVVHVNDPVLSQQIQNRFAKVYDCVNEETLPEREFTPYRRKEKGKLTNTLVLDHHCAHCPFRQKCYPDFELDEKGTHFTKEI